MKHITVNLPGNPPNDYVMYVGLGALEEITKLYKLERYSKAFVVTDESLKPLLEKLLIVLPSGTSSLVLPAGETSKQVATVQAIWTALHHAGCDRKSLVINLGGGVVGDLGGFAASTYMRGVDFLNVPTTLLAQVDASVGGKNGFNFDGVKNLIGTINQPIGVAIDPQVLDKLPDREFLSGFAEIIKHGLIRDTNYLEQVTSKRPLEFSQAELADIILRSCQIKLDIIANDVTEKGQRKLVNFGHTVGHAVEVLSLETARPLLHGEAISIGMVAEASISQRLGFITTSDVNRVTQILRQAGLPAILPESFSIAQLFDKMRSDKKNEGGQLNFTLLDRIGHAFFYNHQIPDSIVTDALQAAKEAQ